MWRIRRRRLYRRFIPRRDVIATSKAAVQNNISTQPESRIIPETYTEQPLPDFVRHMAGYTGKTVTIYTRGGGMAGRGFTGILIRVNSIYIQLIIHAGPAPACSLGNSCSPGPASLFPGCTNTSIFGYGNGIVRSMGTSAYIPTDKIVSFVHNTI